MEVITTNKIGKINEKREFNFVKGSYDIKQVIENLELPFDWVWSSVQCPHCNKQIESKKTHIIYRAEILKGLNNDFIVLVDTQDGKKMLPPKEIKDKILNEYYEGE